MPQLDPLQAVRDAIETSRLVQCSQAIKASPDGPRTLALGDTPVQPLSPTQIAALERAGCTAEDWGKVKAVPGLDPSRLKAVTFVGEVVLGAFSAAAAVADGVELPTGIYHSTVANSCIGSDALVYRVGLLANTVVRERAVLFQVGEVTTTPGAAFGNGAELPIAIETGGRETRVYAEITVDVAQKIAKSRDDRDLLDAYSKAIDDYVQAARCDVGVVDLHAVVKNTGRVVGSYVGPHAEIDNACEVSDSALLSSEDEPTEVSAGACVRASLVQWGCEVTTMAIVQTAVLTEHSHVERHGKVTEAIVGPNSGVAEGEVTASLLGPFVGFHHQALLIAALWPEGKGNVGYGANVGSNHTSKAPDQEIWPGEGAFFGLGVNIKFPADFTRAPYSIIATGVTTLPQKVTFPFSLINAPAITPEGISPAFNEIRPAWVLTDNMFTLKRNEAKYKKRNKARRTTFVFDVFRPDTVDLMADARRRLAEVPDHKQIYTARDVEGLGKNYMLDEARTRAIEAYTFYIRYYALLGLKEKAHELLQASHPDRIPTLLSTPSDDPLWEHQRSLLRNELPHANVPTALKTLRQMVEKVARDVQASKEKDDIRGVKTIPDYPSAHPPAAEDGFVRTTWEETRQTQAEIDALLAAC